MPISISVKGLDKLRDKFGKFPQYLNIALVRAIQLSALLTEGTTKPLTPIDTGRLRSSIQSKIRPLYATIAPHTDYAIFVHEGTQFMRARPFLMWGAQKAEPKIQKIFQIEVEKALIK